MLLAIDTSTHVASIALYRDEGGVRREYTWHSEQSHTVDLMPRIEQILADERTRVTDLSAIGVATGPGSFNGLRVGIAIAKSLAFALSIPCVGIGTLEAFAYQLADSDGEIRPILDAGRGQIATALYAAKSGHGHITLSEVEPPRIAEVREVAGLLTRETLLCGEIKPSWTDEMAEVTGFPLRVASPASRLRRAGFLAELASRVLGDGKAVEPTALQAVYLRRPAVLERLEPSVVNRTPASDS